LSRISERFSQLAAPGEGCLACYLMGGDPSLELSRQAILAVAEAGADIVEIGIPFSEPVGDGPTIQAAGIRALAAGATPESILGMVSQVRRDCSVALVVMTYYNIALRPGLRRFSGMACDSGVDGVILADLPVPEAGPWIEEAKRAGVDTIFLASPTSTEEALQEIGAAATGFVYCVSVLGVTGARESLAAGVGDVVKRIKAHTPLPVLIGFGISSPEHVRDACRVADGVVVGSALVNLVARRQDDHGVSLKRLSEFVAEMKRATRKGQSVVGVSGAAAAPRQPGSGNENVGSAARKGPGRRKNDH